MAVSRRRVIWTGGGAAAAALAPASAQAPRGLPVVDDALEPALTARTLARKMGAAACVPKREEPVPG